MGVHPELVILPISGGGWIKKYLDTKAMSSDWKNSFVCPEKHPFDEEFIQPQRTISPGGIGDDHVKCTWSKCTSNLGGACITWGYKIAIYDAEGNYTSPDLTMLDNAKELILKL